MNNHHNKNKAILWSLIAIALFSAALSGQSLGGILVGTVTDAAGAVLPGATVSAVDKATNVKSTTTTDSNGEYRINNLPVGFYDVSATATGMAAGTTAGVEIQLNHTTSIKIALKVGTVATTVEVTGAAASIDTATAQLQTTYDAKQAVDVPAAGHGTGIWNLSLLGAGVASSGGVGQGTGPSVAGIRPEANSFNIDGVLNDNHYVTGPQVYVPNDAISQFNLVQNQFSAEFGGGGGGIFNAIVKAGGNRFHGGAYEYLQNRNLNAVDAQEVQQGIFSNPRYDNNRVGGQIGGPIKKNKLFFYGLFEYNPIGNSAQPGQTVSAPTAAGISTLNGISGLSKNNLSVFEQYVPVAAVTNGSVTVAGKSVAIGDLSFASPAYSNSYNVVGSVDYNMSNKDQIRGRYFYNNFSGIDAAAALPVFFATSPNVNNSASVSEFHNFSPSMENELRVSFSRNNANTPAGNFTFPGLSVFPNLSFDDLSLQIGPDPNTPSGSIENLFQIQENLTKTWGKHTFKAGYSLVDVILSGFFVQRSRGDYDYSSLQQYLLDQVPDGGSLSGVAGERSVGTANGVPFGHLENNAYFNDDWRIRPNLTLNLGIRYEYVTIPVGSRAQQYSALANVPGVITFGVPQANANEWSPKLGFAYSPGTNGTWSIRGGVSRAFSNSYINLNQNASPPFYATTVDVNANTPVPFLAGGGLQASGTGIPTTVAAARGAVASYTFDQTRPYALTGTLGVQHVMAKDYTIEARYVYTKGVHLWNQTRLNRITPITATNNIPTFFTMPSAATLAGLNTTLAQLQALPTNSLASYGFANNVVGYHPWGNSRYSGLALQVTKRYSKNFQYIAAYTWSHAQDDTTATNFSTILSPRRAQDFQNLRAEWSDSALDRRQRFTFTPVYDWKPFQGQNWLMKNIVGNWNISGTYTFQSPEYATVQSGVDSNLNGDSAGDRAIINTSGSPNVGSGVTGYSKTGAVTTSAASIVAYVAKNSNAQYVVAGLGAYSNGGRNTLPLDHINNFDVALLKKLSFFSEERLKVSFGVQAFNLFNHSQFVGGLISDVAPYSTAAISRNFLVPSNAAFDHYQGFFPSNSRTMQLVAHFDF